MTDTKKEEEKEKCCEGEGKIESEKVKKEEGSCCHTSGCCDSKGTPGFFQQITKFFGKKE
jgi:hypothetical protein